MPKIADVEMIEEVPEPPKLDVKKSIPPIIEPAEPAKAPVQNPIYNVPFFGQHKPSEIQKPQVQLQLTRQDFLVYLSHALNIPLE